MDSPDQATRRPRSISDIPWTAIFSVTSAIGRRGVRIYDVPPQELAVVPGVLFFVGLPAFFLLSMFPVWDYLGRFVWLTHVNELIAPAIAPLDAAYRPISAPHFPEKRFFVATEATTALLLIVSLASALSRKVRKHALLVWICFDRKQLLRLTFVSGLVFGAEWYIIFCDWSFFQLLALLGRRIVSIIMFVAISLPLVTLLFGHLAVIVTLGAYRSAVERLRPRPVYSVAGMTSGVSNGTNSAKKLSADLAVAIECISFVLIAVVVIVMMKIISSLDMIHPPSFMDAPLSSKFNPFVNPPPDPELDVFQRFGRPRPQACRVRY